MKLSIPEEEIVLYRTGFDDSDFLNREPFAEKLSELIDKFETPFVVALDGPWGSGKSFFLKRWVGHHQKLHEKKTVVVYLDAFALDYLDEPMVALVSEISERFENQLPKSQQNWNKAKIIATKLLPSAARIAVGVATAGVSELIAAQFKTAFEKAAEEMDGAVAKLWEREDSRREAVTEFRKFLEGLTKGDGDSSVEKIVVVIDELDRCRPDYALSMLEIIKHFFNVNNVHFILGVNTVELENMARARYGEKLDARNYIGKFIKVKVQLPEKNSGSHIDFCWEQFFDKTVAAMGLKGDFLNEIKFQLKLLPPNKITLRTIQSLLTSAALIPSLIAMKLDTYIALDDYNRMLICSLVFLISLSLRKSDQIKLHSRIFKCSSI